MCVAKMWDLAVWNGLLLDIQNLGCGLDFLQRNITWGVDCIYFKEIKFGVVDCTDFKEIEFGDVDLIYFEEIKFGCVNWTDFKEIKFGTVDWTYFK